MENTIQADIVESLGDIKNVSYSVIDKQTIYPELKRLLLRVLLSMVVVISINYFIDIGIVWPIFFGQKPFDISNLFTPMLGFLPVYLLLASLMFGSQIWNYLLFKHGIAHQIKNGDKLTALMEDIGCKTFKLYLKMLFVLGFIQPSLAVFLSLFIFAFGANIYITMEATRLGIPKVFNRLMKIIDNYKTGKS